MNDDMEELIWLKHYLQEIYSTKLLSSVQKEFLYLPFQAVAEAAVLAKKS